MGVHDLVIYQKAYDATLALMSADTKKRDDLIAAGKAKIAADEAAKKILEAPSVEKVE